MKEMLSYVFRNNGKKINDILNICNQNFKLVTLNRNESNILLCNNDLNILIQNDFTRVVLNNENVNISNLEKIF